MSKRIGFVGTPGSGKSTLARAVAASGHNKLRCVELVAEYARRFLTKYGQVESPADQYKITQKQIEWENAVSPETEVIITDSPIYMGFLYALNLRDLNNPKHTMYINDTFKCMNKINCPQRYDIIFHLPPAWKPHKDGVRSSEHFEDEWRSSADDMIRFIFKLFPPQKFISLNKISLEERVEECLYYIEEYL